MAVRGTHIVGCGCCIGCANCGSNGVQLGVALHPPAHTLQVAERAGLGRTARLPCAGDGPQPAIQPQHWATFPGSRPASGDDFWRYPFLIARAGSYYETLAGTVGPHPEAWL